MTILRKARGIVVILAILLGGASGLSAHPLSTFGVRLQVSSDAVTVILNADESPLLIKLDALAAAVPSGEDVLARVRDHAGLIRSLSRVTADGRDIDLTLRDVRANADRQVEVVLTGALPARAQAVAWQSRLIYGAYPVSVSHGPSGVESVFWLQGAEQSPAMPVQASLAHVATFTGYAGLGFLHIIPRGLDHILFVLGLFLLTPRLRALIAQISVFTIAHSVSLALAIFGVVSLSPSIVEPLIALSIAYVGVENLFRRSLSPHRLWLVAAFGLLHGLGFAGVLAEVSLPASQWLPALLGFNIGVELGQLAVLAMAAVTLWVWTRWVADADRWIRQPASAGIALMGVFWMVTRL